MVVEFVTLSIQDVAIESKKLAREFEKKYQCSPDVIVFIAKGGYLIGKLAAEYFDIPLLEIKAQRSGGVIKNFLAPLIKYIPSKIKRYLRDRELSLGIHAKKTDRNILFYDRQIPKQHNWGKIFLVDDSIDTGYTIKACSDYLKKKFPHAIVYVGGLNVWQQSTSIIQTDCALMYDTAIQGPWSVDSAEYRKYISLYEAWVKGHCLNG